jgi:hypothetical protein
LQDAANGHPHFVNLNPSENHTEFDELDPIDIITTTLLNHCEADFERLLDQKNIVTLHWSIKESSVVHYINRIGDKINVSRLLHCSLSVDELSFSDYTLIFTGGMLVGTKESGIEEGDKTTP